MLAMVRQCLALVVSVLTYEDGLSPQGRAPRPGAGAFAGG